MREAVEVMARDAARRHYARRFGKPEDDPHVSMNVEGNWRALYGADMESALAALDAAGFAVVPKVETDEMCEDGLDALKENLGRSAVIARDAAACYRAMVRRGRAMLAAAQVDG